MIGTRWLVTLSLLALLAAPATLAGEDSSMPWDLIGKDLGIKIQSTLALARSVKGKVVDPRKLALCGLTDVREGEELDVAATRDGLLLSHSGRGHAILTASAGGWWPYQGSSLGFTPDVLPKTGAKVLLLTGTVTDPKLLTDMRPLSDMRPISLRAQKGDRMEFLSTLGGGLGEGIHPQIVPRHFERVNVTVAKGRLRFDRGYICPVILLEIKEQREIPAEKVPSATKVRSPVGASLLRRCELPGIRGLCVGPNGAGKSTLIATVTDVAKASWLGLSKAEAGDRLHLVPGDGLFTVFLCRVKTEEPVCVTWDRDGKASLVTGPAR